MALRDMGISEVTNLDGAAGSTSYNGPEATGLQALWLVVTINWYVNSPHTHTFGLVSFSAAAIPVNWGLGLGFRTRARLHSLQGMIPVRYMQRPVRENMI